MREKMFRATHVLGVLGCLLMLMAVGSAHGSPVTIDTFSTAQSLMVSSDTTASSTAAGAGIIFGERDLFIQRTAGGSGGGDSSYSAGASGGLFSVAEESTVQGKTLIQWDALGDSAPASFSPTSNLTFAGAVDLTMGGLNDRIIARVVAVDFSHTLKFSLFGPNVIDVSTQTLVSPVLISLGDPTQDMVFLFSGFAGSAQLNNIRAITLEITSTAAAGDLTLDLLEAQPPPPPPVIPEPSSLVLLGIGILGVVGYAWRRQKRNG